MKTAREVRDYLLEVVSNLKKGENIELREIESKGFDDTTHLR